MMLWLAVGAATAPACATFTAEGGTSTGDDGGVTTTDASADAASPCMDQHTLCDDFERDPTNLLGPWGALPDDGGATGSIAIVPGAGKNGSRALVVQNSEAHRLRMTKTLASAGKGANVKSARVVYDAKYEQVATPGAIQTMELALGSRDGGNLFSVVKVEPGPKLLLDTAGIAGDAGVGEQTRQATLTQSDWHHVDLTVDFEHDTTTFILDGQPVTADPGPSITIVADFVDAKIGAQTDPGETVKLTVDDYFVDIVY